MGTGTGLAAETPAEGQHAVAELLALLVVHELVGEALLEAGEAHLLGANLGAGLPYNSGVHSVPPLVTVGRVPGCCTTRGAISFSDHIIEK
jgi:hypothetical protein